jgi:hypothetical protein
MVNALPIQAQSPENKGASETSGSSAGATGGGAQGATVDGATKPKTDAESWPWMKDEKPKRDNSPEFTTETPKVAPVTPATPVAPKLSPAPVAPVASAAPVRPVQPVHHQTTKLYGRIEELTGSAGASFPIQLKAMTPQMDTRNTVHQVRVSTNAFSGKIVSSFPTDYRGTWGGNLQISQIQITPLYYQIDSEEARRTAQAMRVGNQGSVNFNFDERGGKVTLEPAQIMFMVPGKDTRVGDEVNRMMGGQSGAFGAMMSQMVSSMPVPIMLNFGNVDTTASAGMETSLAGNQMRSVVLRNNIRQLSPGVLEQQIVTQETTWDKQTRRQRTQYGESVIRFTGRNPSQMLVQAATINYSGGRQCLTKVFLQGWIQRGQVMQNNPYSGLGDMQNLQRMMGAPGGQQPGGQIPQIPGLDPNMLKNLFGQ